MNRTPFPPACRHVVTPRTPRPPLRGAVSTLSCHFRTLPLLRAGTLCLAKPLFQTTLLSLALSLQFLSMAQARQPAPDRYSLPVLDETFDGGFRHPGWTGDTSDFLFVREADRPLLRLSAPEGKRSSQLSLPLEIPYGRWEFWFRFDFTASNLNRVFLFLLADRADLDFLSGSTVSGYALQLGENGNHKKIRLLRFDRGQRTELLSTHTELQSGRGYRITVTRDVESRWQISVLPDGSGLAETTPEITDATWSTSGHFGFLLRYTAANSNRFFFGDLRADALLPKFTLEELHQPDSRSLELRFNLPLDPRSLKADAFMFQKHPPPRQILPTGHHSVQLLWDVPLPGGPDILTFRNLRPLLTSAGGDHSVPQNVEPPEPVPLLIASPPRPGDIIINEILFEPLGELQEDGRAQSQYIELYNRKPYALSLKGVHLRERQGAAGARIHPAEDEELWIPGEGFALLYPETGSGDFSRSRVARFFDLPDPSDPPEPPGFTTIRFDRSTLGLAASGRTVLLSDESGQVLDRVDYRRDWHNPNRISTRGISLERIAPGSASNDPANWSSSTDLRGGTPGRANSLLAAPDSTGYKLGIHLAPNPFSPDSDGEEDHLVISWRFDRPDYLIRLRIFDRYGREVRTLAREHPAGLRGQLIWDGRGERGERNRIGIYIVLLEAWNAMAGTRHTFREPVVLAAPF